MSWKMTAQELLERYADGERDFAGVDLHGVDLSNAVLRGINLDRADLSDVNFTSADLSGDRGRRFPPFIKETGIVDPSQFSSLGLGSPIGGYTCVRYAILTNANFCNTDLSYVDFSHSDLSFANFNKAYTSSYGDGVNFEYARLSWSKWDDAEIGIISFEEAIIEGTPLENAEY